MAERNEWYKREYEVDRMEMYELRRGGHVKRIERQVEPQREMIAVRHNDRDRRNVVRNGQSVNLNDRISLAANANPLDWKKNRNATYIAPAFAITISCTYL